MYKLVPGDVLHTGKTSIESVKKCLRFVIGNETPNEEDLHNSDFNRNGKIDLEDTLKVLKIAENTKTPVYIHENVLRVDTDIVGEPVLGIIVTLNTNTGMSSLVPSNYMCLNHENKIYVENVSHPTVFRELCSLHVKNCYIITYEIVIEKGDILYYITS